VETGYTTNEPVQIVTEAIEKAVSTLVLKELRWDLAKRFPNQKLTEY
jgi:hypothetical protein